MTRTIPGVAKDFCNAGWLRLALRRRVLLTKHNLSSNCRYIHTYQTHARTVARTRRHAHTQAYAHTHEHTHAHTQKAGKVDAQLERLLLDFNLDLDETLPALNALGVTAVQVLSLSLSLYLSLSLSVFVSLSSLSHLPWPLPLPLPPSSLPFPYPRMKS
jgi:hypothetical protein